MTTLVAATLASHFLYLFAIGEPLLSLNSNVTLSLEGTVQPPRFATFSLLALLLYSVFVVVLVPGRKKLWAPVIALVSAPPAALCVSYIDAHGSIIWNGAMLAPLWQTALAGFLGVALTLTPVDVRSPGKRFAVLYVLAGYFLLFGTLSYFASISDRKRIDENDRRMAAKIAAWLAAAPSRDNLPELEEQPLDQVLLMDGVGDWKPDRSGSTDLAAEQQGQYTTEAPRPDRIEYHVLYSRIALVPEGARWLRAIVTQFPNRAWAEYAAVNRGTSWFEGQSLTRSGTQLRRRDKSVWWSSGNMLIFLDYYGDSMTGGFDELLKAYLAKYPQFPMETPVSGNRGLVDRSRQLRHQRGALLLVLDATHQQHEHVRGGSVDDGGVVMDADDVAGLVRDRRAGRQAGRNRVVERLPLQDRDHLRDRSLNRPRGRARSCRAAPAGPARLSC